ncbi:hypothetical protein B296_00054949, partial [Ensete ventricosum]
RHARSLLPPAVAVFLGNAQPPLAALAAVTQPLPPLLCNSRRSSLPSLFISSSQPPATISLSYSTIAAATPSSAAAPPAHSHLLPSLPRRHPPLAAASSSLVAAVFFSPAAAALAGLSLPSSFLPCCRSPHPCHPCRCCFLSIGCFFLRRPPQFLLFITVGHPCHLPLQPLQPTAATSFSQPPADLLLTVACSHRSHTPTRSPPIPCLSPYSLLLTCRRCHPSWAAACHSSPLPPLLCCYRQLLLLPRRRTIAPPPLPAAVVASSHASSSFFPLQPPLVGPRCLPGSHFFFLAGLVSISITIAPPLRRKLMPLTRHQKKKLTIYNNTTR